MDAERNENNDRLDEATARRLRRLRTMPVDTTRLEQRLRSSLPQTVPTWRVWLRPVRAAAAVLVILSVVVALLFATSGGSVLASPAQMAQMHEEIVSGRTPVMQVNSIDAANEALAAQWPQSPEVPEVPQDHVMACCMKSVKDKKVACVLLKSEGVPLTMMVAKASDMRPPASQMRTYKGLTYHLQSHGRLNMIMTEREGRWVCLIGEVAAERLMDVAAKLRF